MMKPNRKISYAGLSGALLAVLTWVLSANGVDMSPEAVAGIMFLVMSGIGYAVPLAGDPANEVE
jgi:hypothetical protein